MKSMGNRARRALQGLAAGLALLLLASCGGGTEQVTPFDPARYLAFGDEMSVLTKDLPQGRKYTVNGLASDGSIDCLADSSGLWIQAIGNEFDFVFEQCNPSGLAVAAFTYAAPGAKVADFATQLAEARLKHGSFNCNDLMSVLVGANDVIELFENVYLADPTPDTANAVTNELTARGRRLGQAIAALTDNDGPQVIVSTIPLMNLTPWALRWSIVRPGADVLNVLSNFSNAFNTALRVTIPNDGTRWGLVELDAMVQAAVNNPDNYGLLNTTQALCAPSTWDTPNCTTNTLVADASPDDYLWASNKWISWQAHSRLGNFARDRATGNPFGCN
jgi:outer membrane lipase/esterase